GAARRSRPRAEHPRVLPPAPGAAAGPADRQPVIELTWLLDPATGALVVEGLTVEEASALAGDLLPSAGEINCARPLATSPLPAAAHAGGPTALGEAPALAPPTLA